MADDQHDVIELLRKPSSYGGAVERVDVIETHASFVFLAGDRAYKLKRAVKYSYLDFSTAERRRGACEAEFALNRRTAPDLYLEIRTLALLPNGRVGFATDEPAIDWLVVMRRFDQAMLFDALAGTGGLTQPLMAELAGRIAAFHQAAERRPNQGDAAALAAVVETNHGCLMTAREAGFEPKRIIEVRQRSLERIASVSALLEIGRAHV